MENKYSKLFLKYVPKYYSNNGKSSAKHPFQFLEDLCNKEYKGEIDFIRFDEGFSFYNELKVKSEYAQKWFVFEYSLIKGNNEYINKIVSSLIKLYRKLNSINKESSHYAINKKSYYNIIQTIIKEILVSIFISYHLDLNKTNREYLSKWYYLKESISSFKFIKNQEDKRLKELFEKYLKYTFIDINTPFDTFKTLFEERNLVNKINWIDQKTTLYFFIKLLRQHKVIKNTKNKHWLITSEFFLLRGETLMPKDFLNQKEPQTKLKREKLEKFVLALKV